MNSTNPDINPVKSFFKSVEKKLLKHSKHLYFKTVISQKSGAKNIIKKYKEASTGKSPIDKTCPIWTCWWQGEANMPDIVKVCYASAKHHAGQHPVILVTEQNYQEYATMPDYILQKVKNHEISLTHFSDMLRINLLKEHGGIWADSTLLFTRDVDSIMNPDTDFYTCHHTAKNTNVANGKWTVFFIACGKDNILPAFLLDMFYSYWKNHQQIVTYLFFDYLVSIAYENIPAITEMVDSVPLQRISNLSKCLNMPFNEKSMEEFSANYGFHKLTYKKQFNMLTPEGKETIYAHLLHNSTHGIDADQT
jgi:hypothetical protein